ncbi:unnamed protein product, partial [Polarella glacialis]
GLKDLRSRAASWALAASGPCPGADSASFLLIDRRRQLAKVFTDADPRLLVVFLRSMQNPSTDGLIVADTRSKADLQRAFENVHAFADPPTEYSVCTSPLKKNGPKYSIHQGSGCGSSGWELVQGGVWRAYAKGRPGIEEVTFCDNEKHWVQKVVNKASCPKEWAKLKWVSGGTFYVPEQSPGKVFCVGSRESTQEDLSFSRLLPRKNCSGDGFRHEFNFGTVMDTPVVVSMVVCIGRDQSGRRSRVSTGQQCSQDGFVEMGHFPATQAAAATSSDTIFCVTNVASSDVIEESRGGKCDSDVKMTFALPIIAPKLAVSQAEPEELMRRTQVCLGALPDAGNVKVLAIGSECSRLQDIVLLFQVPSLLEIAASTPYANEGNSGLPLFALVEEEVTCFGFLCPNTML